MGLLGETSLFLKLRGLSHTAVPYRSRQQGSHAWAPTLCPSCRALTWRLANMGRASASKKPQLQTSELSPVPGATLNLPSQNMDGNVNSRQ